MIGTALALGLVLCAQTSSVAVPPSTSAPPPASLRDVSFIAGHWVDGGDTDRSEEVWTEPAGDSMLGMWRLVAGSRVRVMELLVLKEESGSVVLRFRHFDPLLVAREEKTTPLVLRLVRVAPGDVRFEGLTADGSGTLALTYRRPAEGALEVTLERGGKTDRFSFRRK